MSKRNDNPSDADADMTTAERRRYRRRGGALRVPSDDVPRSATPSRPPTRTDGKPANTRTNDAEPIGITAPDGAPTVIDPPPHSLGGSAAHPGDPWKSVTRDRAAVIDPPGEGVDRNADFETKTHEMSVVDLEALGLSDAATTLRIERISTSDRAATHETAEHSAIATEPGVQVHDDVSGLKRRAQTVALSDEDLEEVRGARAPSPLPPPAVKPTTKPPPLTASPLRSSPLPRPLDAATSAAMTNAASPQTTRWVKDSVPESIAEIDSAAEPTGEYEVEIEDSAPVESETALPATDPPAVAARPSATPPTPPRPADQPAVAATPLVPPPPPSVAKSPPQPPQARKPSSPPAQSRLEARSTGARVKPWYVDLFDEDYLRTLPFLTPQATQAEAEFVLETMNLGPGAQVLDVGCGYGRHAMELAARGLHVVGLDLSTPLLIRGGEEAQRRGLTINFVRGDMRELDFDNQFDAAYCLFSTFGYFEDETNKTTLANIARALKPKGKVLLEVLNRDYLIADLPARVWWEGDGCVVLEEVEFNYFSSRVLVNRSVVFDDGRQLEQEISVRAYSLHEVGKLMHAAGFRVLEVSGGYQMRGRFFGNQSRHIIVLGERKEP